MIHLCCLKSLRVATVMVVLAICATHAQTTPPRPTFDITQHPALYFNVWPADLNRDGFADLVAGTAALFPQDPGDVVIAMGRGNGTFSSPVAIAFRAMPLVPADFNRDNFVDLVIRRGQQLEILPGNGDGTFDPAVPIDENVQQEELRYWAFSADMDGDQLRDLIVPHQTGDEFVLRLYPGTGTFTFGAPIDLPTAPALPPAELTSGDFNGDGRRDLALVNHCCALSIYLNRGGHSYTRTDIPAELNDVTAADITGDGRLDLIAVKGRYQFWTSVIEPGQVVVFAGNGNGTFQPGVSYSTGVNGTTSVVVGDFNGDTRLDVATSNRSVVADDERGFNLADSVSVLPGDGTGRLLAPAVYALAYIRQGEWGLGFERPPFWGANHELNTADLNGDRRTDLITSPGATLLNRTPRTNRAPVVFAGPDRTEFLGSGSPLLFGAYATDADMDWLTYEWRDDTGRVISRLPAVSSFQFEGVTRTFTVTVSDGRGGVATDSVTIRNWNPDSDPFVGIDQIGVGADVQAGVPHRIRWTAYRIEMVTGFSLSFSVDDGRTFTTIPGCDNLAPTVVECVWQNPGPLSDQARLRIIARGANEIINVTNRFRIVSDPVLPSNWTSSDIGAVAARGTASFDSGTWTVEGSGADIWNAADEFRYVYMEAGTQFTFTTRVASLENVHVWAKAGIMVREDLSPGSRHVSAFATPGRGLAFQRRQQPNGISETTAGPAITAPVWLRVGRIGDTVSAYYRTSPTEPWTLLGRQTLSGLRSVLYVGLAVTSHLDGQLATGRFDNVAFELAGGVNRREDVGSVGVPGSTSYDGVVYQLRGSGADIWGTADAFHFAFTRGFYGGQISSITARVRSIQNTHVWAKGGVMFRELVGSNPSPTANGRHVMVAVTPGRGIEMQYRSTAGGPAVQVAVVPGTAPALVRISRSGDTFTGFYSRNGGATWQQLGQVTLTSLFAEPGLIVTSHNNAVLATATFDDLAFTFFP